VKVRRNYNPSLTIKENAKRNGVTEASIRLTESKSIGNETLDIYIKYKAV
jgi:hypothetical protein